jgi:hypothetical protein
MVTDPLLRCQEMNQQTQKYNLRRGTSMFLAARIYILPLLAADVA